MIPTSPASVDAAVRVFTLLTVAESCAIEGANDYALDAVQTASWEQPLASALMAAIGNQSLRRIH